MNKPDGLTRLEWDQLRTIGNETYRDGVYPYWWGRKTMPKLAIRGFVEPHPKHPKGWRITEAGREVIKAAIREDWNS